MIIDKIYIKRLSSYFALFLFLPFWWMQKLIKRKKYIWIFGSWHGATYSDNSKAFFEYINHNHEAVVSIWLTRDSSIRDHLINKGYKCFMVNSIKGIFYSLLAKNVIISCAKSDVNRFFINGAKIIHLWHGAPMKQIGLDENIDSEERRETNRELDSYYFWRLLPKYFFTFFDEYNVDFLVSTSNQFSSKMQSAFKISEEKILTTGYPRNDILFKKDKKIYKYKENIDLLIMYMPTFRSDEQIDSLINYYEFSINRIEKLLKKINGRLLIKAHFASSNTLNNYSGRVLYIKNDPLIDVNHILKDVDILITDYSGCYFDFLLLDRPIIFAPFDYLDYINKDRKLYFDYNEIIAGPFAKNWKEVEEEIVNIHNGYDIYKEKRQEMKLLFNKYVDPNSSERLFNIINNVN